MWPHKYQTCKLGRWLAPTGRPATGRKCQELCVHLATDKKSQCQLGPQGLRLRVTHSGHCWPAGNQCARRARPQHHTHHHYHHTVASCTRCCHGSLTRAAVPGGEYPCQLRPLHQQLAPLVLLAAGTQGCNQHQTLHGNMKHAICCVHNTWLALAVPSIPPLETGLACQLCVAVLTAAAAVRMLFAVWCARLQAPAAGLGIQAAGDNQNNEITLVTDHRSFSTKHAHLGALGCSAAARQRVLMVHPQHIFPAPTLAATCCFTVQTGLTSPHAALVVHECEWPRAAAALHGA